MLGDSGVGKTTIIDRYKGNKFSTKMKATVGADFWTKEIKHNGHTISLQIWDTAGQERFQALSSAFYRGSDAWIICFDLTKKVTFENLNIWRDNFKKHSSLAGIENYPVVLVGNKSDLTDEREVKTQLIDEWKHENGCENYYQVSAKDGKNVSEIFEQAVVEIMKSKANGKVLFWYRKIFIFKIC